MATDSNQKTTRTIRTAAELADLAMIDPHHRAEIDQVAEQYAVAITPSIMQVINGADPTGGVARQYIPSPDELTSTESERDDPIGDHAHSPLPGIIHRYPDRALLNLLKTCAVYCRFCFRREQVGPHNKALSDEQVDDALDYIRSHDNIWEVILSGGDPLMLPAAKLARVSSTLNDIGHVRVLRLHTRLPAVAPERITDGLIKALGTFTPTYVAVHINHPDEFTAEVKAALNRLADAGIPLLGQTVLLRSINDNVSTLERLFRTMVETRIRPYYLHIADKARGTAHFRTSLKTGEDLMRELRGSVSGLCQPTLVLDIPGGYGKVPVGPSYVEHTDDHGAIITDVKGRPHLYKCD